MPVFSLSEVRTNQIKNYENTFEEQVVSSYGYLVGGLTPASVSNVERVDFSTDTILDPGSRNVLNGYAGSSGTKNVGDGIDNYVYGGLPSANHTRVTRFSYSNETFQNTSTNLGLTHYYQGLTSNSQYAFIGGGQSPPQTPSDSNVIYRMNFSTETISTPGNNLPSGVRGVIGFSNSSFGFYANGFDAANTCAIYRLNFSNETLDASAYAHTQKASGYSFATSNPEYAYVAGGYSATDSDNISSIQRYDFSASTTSILPTAVETQTDKEASSSIESSTTGYFGGGYQRPATPIATGERLDFGTETISNLQNLASGRGYLHASFTGGSKITRGTPNFENWNESATYGYTICRLDSSYESNIDRIDMTTEVTSLPGSNDASNPRAGALTFSSNQYGYGLMGNDSSNYRTDITRIDFISETSSRLEDALKSISNYTGRGTQNKNYGYGSGGYDGSNTVSTTVRFDFNTESFSELGKNLGVSKTGIGQLHSESYGYFAGGQIPSAGNVDQDGIDKFDFSTESMFAIAPKLNTARDNCIGNQSNNFGYFAGGVTSGRVSYVDRIDLSTDTTSTANNLTGARDGMGSTNTLSYGYWLGGNNPSLSPNRLSIVNRIDFETETISNPGNPMRSKGTGTSSIQANTTIKQIGKNNRNDSRAGLDNQGRNVGASYGYYGGGYRIGSSIVSVQERLDYLNETISISSNLPSALKVGMIGFENTNFGYYGGGRYGVAPTSDCSVYRFDFTNESVSNNPSNYFNVSRLKPLRSENNNYGYIAGGLDSVSSPSVYLSSIDRFDFAVEIPTIIPSVLVESRFSGANAYTNTTGYYAAGKDASGWICSIERIDFSSETTSLMSGQLVQIRNEPASIQDSALSYFCGGQSPGPSILSTITKLEFSTETVSAPTTKMNKELHRIQGSYNVNYGYIGAGVAPIIGYVSTCDRLEFINETFSEIGNNFFDGRGNLAAIQNTQ